ncbi:MAG: DNA cytosine methyltransferase [Candidatus Saganbacteria bacterium]|nr:DNA cytosine methyltransferase [Candidatus Saganbacteria bacterium]
MRIVSLFSGAGGLDLGFIQAGHKIIWANDIDEDSVNTYKSNIGDHIVLGPIEKISVGSIPDCDMVIGGFPCQGFSVANTKRNARDSRNKLYLQLLRVIRRKKPKYFIAENVKGLVSFAGGKVLKMIIKDFSSCGYNVRYKVLNAADYGVPQLRERVIIMGVRKDVLKEVEFPAPTHRDPLIGNSRLPIWLSIGKALRNIPEPEASSDMLNHTCSKYKLLFNGYIGHRYIDPDRPAPTVTARGDKRGGVVVLHHPKNHRRMSARELATTQSFPLSFGFKGCRSSVYRQIGNAVPPILAKAIANMFPIN